MLRVLVIEDDAGVRDIVERVLVARGYQVHLAASGEEALEASHDTPPDLVVSDIVLPGRDGFQTVAAIRQRWPHVRACFMSGQFEPSLASAAGLVLERPVLRKPFALTELVSLVQSLHAEPVCDPGGQADGLPADPVS
jgi:CheY-like chemotaxis protein